MLIYDLLPTFRTLLSWFLPCSLISLLYWMYNLESSCFVFSFLFCLFLNWHLKNKPITKNVCQSNYIITILDVLFFELLNHTKERKGICLVKRNWQNMTTSQVLFSGTWCESSVSALTATLNSIIQAAYV